MNLQPPPAVSRSLLIVSERDEIWGDGATLDPDATVKAVVAFEAVARSDIALPAAPSASSSAVRAVMQGNSRPETKPEIALRSALHRKGFRFRKQTRADPSVRCRADIVFARERVAVFVDGCFWHACPEHGTSPRTNSPYWTAKLARNVERDRRNDAALASMGWTVLRIWEHEDPSDAAERVAGLLRSRR